MQTWQPPTTRHYLIALTWQWFCQSQVPLWEFEPHTVKYWCRTTLPVSSSVNEVNFLLNTSFKIMTGHYYYDLLSASISWPSNPVTKYRSTVPSKLWLNDWLMVLHCNHLRSGSNTNSPSYRTKRSNQSVAVSRCQLLCPRTMWIQVTVTSSVQSCMTVIKTSHAWQLSRQVMHDSYQDKSCMTVIKKSVNNIQYSWILRQHWPA